MGTKRGGSFGINKLHIITTRLSAVWKSIYVTPMSYGIIRNEGQQTIRTKIGNLMRRLASLIRSLRGTQPLKILILGAKDCGKTSIVRRYAGDLFYEEKEEPVSNTFRTGMLVEMERKIEAYDTTITELSKDKQSDSVYRSRIKAANAFILVYSKTEYSSVLELIQILRKLYLMKKTKYATIVIANKTDLQDNVDHQEQNNAFERQMEYCGYPCFQVSARYNEGIVDAFLEISKLHSTRLNRFWGS